MVQAERSSAKAPRLTSGTALDAPRSHSDISRPKSSMLKGQPWRRPHGGPAKPAITAPRQQSQPRRVR
eukprot:4792361-Alexandrium_andersonii.AAC.1